jgi:hypothetical protein
LPTKKVFAALPMGYPFWGCGVSPSFRHICSILGIQKKSSLSAVRFDAPDSVGLSNYSMTSRNFQDHKIVILRYSNVAMENPPFIVMFSLKAPFIGDFS